VWFAEHYGWTPDQVDKLPLHLSDWYMPISGAIAKERDRREESAMEAAIAKAK
jgi:hypothetical protein